MNNAVRSHDFLWPAAGQHVQVFNKCVDPSHMAFTLLTLSVEYAHDQKENKNGSDLDSHGMAVGDRFYYALFKRCSLRDPHPGALGVVAEGALADILLINGDPLKDISLLTKPEENLALIMKDGKIYKKMVK